MSAVILEVGFRLGGCVYTFFVEQANRRSLQNNPTYRIMCLGESTTVCGGENAYPRQLERILNSRDIGIRFSVLNKGIGATQTTNIVALLEGNLDAYRPNMVITMMGVNDGLGTLAYEETPAVKIKLWLRGFRVYKFIGLLKEHILLQLERIRQAQEPKREVRRKEPGQERAIISADKCLELAATFYQQGNIVESEEFYKRAIEINPRLDRAYALLGQFYEWRGRHHEGEEMCRKAIEINPENDLAHAELGMIYEANNWEKAEPMYRKAFELNPQNNFAFSQLISRYLGKGRFKEAEALARIVIELAPENDRAWGALALCCESQGERELGKELLKKANELRAGYFNQATARNYQKLRGILKARGIRLICAQYPMRKVELLKMMLPDREGVIFVDNGKIFQEAARRDGYGKYFCDNFGGDFGHGTQEGNRLLARNVADAILKEVFQVAPSAGPAGEGGENECRGENLLQPGEATVTASSESIPGGEVSQLRDGDLSTLWHVRLEEVGKPAWVTVDFGENQSRIVRSLRARPRPDEPDQFLRNAELLGSADGEKWETVAALAQEQPPRGDEWRAWTFANGRAYRYYRLSIADGHAGGEAHRFYSLAELEMLE